jgi:hypothetical protein
MRCKNVRWQIVGGAGLAYALLICLMTLPLLPQFSSRLLGHSIDSWIFYWNNWRLERAIQEGRNWLFTPYLFYPQGASLAAHSNSFLNSLLALPLRPLVGPVAAYNLVLLLGLWISGVGMFSLIYEMTRCPPAALLAGFVFACTPYHLTQALAHDHLGSIQWWPFYILFLRRALCKRRAADAVYAGLFAALTLWTGLHLALLLAIWTAGYMGWHLLCQMDSDDRNVRSYVRVAGAAGIIGAVVLALGAPILLSLAREWRQIADVAKVFDEGMATQTDLLAYLIPPGYNPLVGQYTRSIYTRFETNASEMPYLGYTALGLAAISLFSRRKETRFWLLSMGVWMMLAAGSAPRLNGVLYPDIPLPYRFIGHIFPISAVRTPDRFNLLTILSLSVAVGLGAAHLARRRRWLLIPSTLLILAEYMCLPLPTWDLPPDSPFYAQMAQDDVAYGVVDYPMGYTAGKRWLYYQTLHGKPLVAGHISRYTLENYAFIVSQPLLRAFYQVAEKPHYLAREAVFADEPRPVPALGPALRSLRDSGVRYILLHKPYPDAIQQAHFRRVLPILPVYEDATLAVYDTARPMPVYYDGFPVPLNSAVALARFDACYDGGAEWQFQVLALLLAQDTPPLDCQIQLLGEAGETLTLPITFFETPTEIAWKTGDLEVIETAVSLPQDDLAPGAYRWAVTCPGEDATTYTAPEKLEVHADGHTTYLRRQVNVLYGDAIELTGYRWRTPGVELQVTLRWKTLQRPDDSYKVFVHLLNTGQEIVAQYDAIPCHWQCPTTQWQAGDVVRDQAIVPLGALPPGDYRIAVGLYSEETLERLPVQDPDRVSHPDGYFVLPDHFFVSSGDR